MRFPHLEAQDLNERPLDLPGGLAGEFNLLLLGYADWQRRWIDSWLPFAGRLEAAYPSFRWYELPVAGWLSDSGRFFFNEGLRAATPQFDGRTRVVPIYVDRQTLNHRLDIAGTRQMVALLVQRDGAVLWRETGAWTAGKADALDEVLLARTRPEDFFA